jgi:hypothetical protein
MVSESGEGKPAFARTVLNEQGLGPRPEARNGECKHGLRTAWCALCR